MYLATAYPNSALSALTLTVIALVVAGSLALWLGLVFLADREPRGRQARAGLGGANAGPAEPGTAENEHGELEEEHAAEHHHGVAA